MKTVLSFITLTIIIGMSVGAFIFFQQADYRTSALLTGGSFLAISFWIHQLITQKKVAFQ